MHASNGRTDGGNSKSTASYDVRPLPNRAPAHVRRRPMARQSRKRKGKGGKALMHANANAMPERAAWAWPGLARRELWEATATSPCSGGPRLELWGRAGLQRGDGHGGVQAKG